MAHQVFVSYATEDADTASRVCTLLEADSIPCWVAPRDVEAGTDYAAAIMNAIRNSQLVVLIFSVHSNASPYALREIDRAAAYGRPVLALRTDDTYPNPSLEYYLHDWIEAPEGVESKRKEIVAAVRAQLTRSATAAMSAVGGPGSPVRPPVALQSGVGKGAARARPWYLRTWVIAIAGVLVVAALGVGLGFGLTQNRAVPPADMIGNHIAWTELRPSGTLPPVRGFHATAYDPESGRLIVFGGRGAGASRLDDTWAYDPRTNKWMDLHPPGALPLARLGVWQSMVYDPSKRQAIMFGGASRLGIANDTWTYDPVGNKWTNLNPTGAVPSPRYAHAMVYAPQTGKLIMFGGFDGITVASDDTWAYDPSSNTWTNLKPAGTVPQVRYAQAMAYDPSTGKIVMFGGGAGGSVGADTPTVLFNDTWAYDPAANTWTELKPPGTVPSPRCGQSMVYDPATGKLIMFGGGFASAAYFNDVWAYDPVANAWTNSSRRARSHLHAVGFPWRTIPPPGG